MTEFPTLNGAGLPTAKSAVRLLSYDAVKRGAAWAATAAKGMDDAIPNAKCLMFSSSGRHAARKTPRVMLDLIYAMNKVSCNQKVGRIGGDSTSRSRF